MLLNLERAKVGHKRMECTGQLANPHLSSDRSERHENRHAEITKTKMDVSMLLGFFLSRLLGG